MAMGRVDESIAMVKRRPRDGSAVVGAERRVRHAPVPGAPLRRSRRLLREAVDRRCRHFLLHFGSASCLQQGLWQLAIDEMETAVALSGRSTEALTGLAQRTAPPG
jgi:hypothetical protein